jgi:hypothetical protein
MNICSFKQFSLTAIAPSVRVGIWEDLALK